MSAETFTTNSDDFNQPGTWAPRSRSRSKNNKIRSFNGRTRFCLMPFVTRVTHGTVAVKISAARKAVMKACKVQNGN